jgi:hypothetical protein
MSENIELMAAYLPHLFGNDTGISYIDSTPIQVCKPKIISSNKVFANHGEKYKSTIG